MGKKKNRPSYKSASKNKRKERKRRESDKRQAGRIDRLKRERAAQRELDEWKPIVEIDQGDATDDFVSLVTSLVSRIPYEDGRFFSAGHRLFYRRLKNTGAMSALSSVVAHDSFGESWATLHELNIHFGSVLILQMTDAEVAKHLPFNDVLAVLEGNRVKLTLSSLRTERLNGQPLSWNNSPCYYSPYKPTVRFGDSEKIVAFSSHAIQRICERLAPLWKTYGGLGEAYGFFHDCLYFEVCEINNEGNPQPAITFYQDCFLDQWQPEVWQLQNSYFFNVITAADLPDMFNQHWYYRVGYCPIERRGEFAVATTLLPPGFSATPENELLRKSSLPREQKRDMLRRAKEQGFTFIAETFDFEVIRWFHENGIKQVRALPGDIFARPLGSPVQGERPLPVNTPGSGFNRLIQQVIQQQQRDGKNESLQ